MTDPIPKTSDEELARETQAGLLASFEELVRRYEHRVHAFARQFCGNAEDAREVTQDTFVKAFQSVGQFDSRRMFASWLFTIARRKCIDRHRRAWRASREIAKEEMMTEGDPAESSAQREEGENLWRLAKRRLGGDQFQALWLHYAEDMEVKEIARVMGRSRVGVKVLLFRARKVLAKELERRDGGILPQRRGGAERESGKVKSFVGCEVEKRRTLGN